MRAYFLNFNPHLQLVSTFKAASIDAHSKNKRMSHAATLGVMPFTFLSTKSGSSCSKDSSSSSSNGGSDAREEQESRDFGSPSIDEEDDSDNNDQFASAKRNFGLMRSTSSIFNRYVYKGMKVKDKNISADEDVNMFLRGFRAQNDSSSHPERSYIAGVDDDTKQKLNEAATR